MVVHERGSGRARLLVCMMTVNLALLSPATLRPARAATVAEATSPSKRMTVAVLWLEDQTGDPNLAHWRYASTLLKSALDKVQAIRPLSTGAVEYAYRKAGLRPGDPVDPNQARQMGLEIEAQRVIWGSYQKADARWHVEVRVANVATGAVSPVFSITTDDWLDARDGLLKALLAELEITPTRTEHEKMTKRYTNAPEAIRWVFKTYLSQEEGRPVTEQETYSRRAIAADPNFALPYTHLAVTLAAQGKLDKADDVVHQALALKANMAAAHGVLGAILLARKEWDPAIEALERACELAPDDSSYLTSLARVYSARNQWDQVVELLEGAISLDRTDALAYAHLAFAYVRQNRRQRAIPALADARLYMPEGVHAIDPLWMLGLTYSVLGKGPKALECYRRIVTLARERAADPAQIQIMEDRIQKISEALKPTFIEDPIPKRYSRQELNTILREKLTEDERRLIGDPFACSESMKQWAQELTQEAQTDFDKTKAIFDALAARVGLDGYPRSRTAVEVFEAWNDPNVPLMCVDHAVLYVTLARAVGLDAFLVIVTRDQNGEVVSHSCAAVYPDDRALLVDASWSWFGIAHREYTVLDDVQAIARLALMNQTFNDETAARYRAALKLHPDCLPGQLLLVEILRNDGQIDQAQRLFDRIAEPSSAGWRGAVYWQCRADLAISKDRWDEAETYLLRAASFYPNSGKIHFALAGLYVRQGRLAEARSEYRAALRGEFLHPNAVRTAREAIAQINEAIGEKDTSEEAAASVP